MAKAKKPASKSAEKVNFEEALEALQEIVDALEAGELPLEDSLKQYEEGVKLARVCTEKLKTAQRRVEILTAGEDGGIETEAFDEKQVEE